LVLGGTETMTKAALEKAAADLAVKPYTEYPLLTDPEFKTMAEEFNLLCIRIGVDENRKKALSKDLEAYLTSAEAPKVELWAGLKLKIGNGRSASTISATKLLELGVPLETIQAATVEGTPYTYAQIERPKAQKGGQ
jgi:hypothetical protein